MYGKFDEGFKVINERATTELQYRGMPLADMYGPTHPLHVSTLPGMTQMVIPMAQSTLMTQSSQMPAIPSTLPPVRDILEPTSNEQARSNYLERQMRWMGSIASYHLICLLWKMEWFEDPTVYKKENKAKRKQEWESHRIALERMKESKEQQ